MCGNWITYISLFYLIIKLVMYHILYIYIYIDLKKICIYDNFLMFYKLIFYLFYIIIQIHRYNILYYISNYIILQRHSYK